MNPSARIADLQDYRSKKLIDPVAFFCGFGHAFRGLFVILRTQRNAWVHLTATVVVSIAAFLTNRNAVEWGLLILAIGVVWVAEAVNSAIEFLSDRVSPESDPLIRDAKDAAAASVLAASLASIGLAITAFWRWS